MTTGFYSYRNMRRLLYNGSLYEKNSAALWLSENGYTGTLQQAAKSVNPGTRGAANRALRFQNKQAAPVAIDWSAVTRVEYNARMVYWKLFAGDKLIDRIDDMIGASVELIARMRAVQTLYRDWTETRLDDWHTVYTKPASVAIDMTPELLAALAEYVRQTAYAVEYEMTPYWRELDIVRQWDGDWLIVSPDFVAATDTDAYDLFRLVHVSAVKRVLTRERYWRTLTFEDRNVLDMYPELES